MGTEGTKERIERCAMAEFLEKGFNGASLRRIVKEAGVTTGAFYKYYPTKEALFAGLVSPVAEGMLRIWSETYDAFLRQTPEAQVTSMRAVNDSSTRRMVDFAYENRDATKLLLTASEGTPYADFVHQLAARETQSTLRFVDTLREAGTDVPKVDDEFVHMIWSGMFGACFEVVLHDMDREHAYQRISLLEEFYLAGWERVLGVTF